MCARCIWKTCFIIIELLSTLNPKRENQGYMFNFQIYSNYQVHNMCINLQNLQIRWHAPRRNLGTLRHAKKHDNLRGAHTI